MNEEGACEEKSKIILIESFSSSGAERRSEKYLESRVFSVDTFARKKNFESRKKAGNQSKVVEIFELKKDEMYRGRRTKAAWKV